MNKIIKNLNAIKENIKIAADEADRDIDDIKLIIVTKKFTEERIRPLLDEGHLCFGENRVQEAQDKWSNLLDEYENLELHLIGPLQTNKVKPALELFTSIHTIDRLNLVDKLVRNEKGIKKIKEFFVQINLANEKQKSGLLIDELDDFINKLEGKLNISGLMCIPPREEEPEIHFAFLNQIAKRINVLKLSMGMSSDFHSAILFGATHIRIGEAIMGKRID
ncbi:MAG: YggS family pyridoxal phosphate-dependent enzyme [Rhodobiaceae bacterium]|nr:YggS family pyridoxal phosphate-dependent enzyme [Rhodobiaceae bacterium]|tara:strand:- start:358 stop:1020 length:663 start_codon:yes stop_codon:yes gene_type:complete